MGETFLTRVEIKSVRHLSNIPIPLSESVRKHLIFTGKNGSGKTSVLEAMANQLQYVISDLYKTENEIRELCNHYRQRIQRAGDSESERLQKQEDERSFQMWMNYLEHWTKGAVASCTSFAELREKYEKGQFVLAYYGDQRRFQAEKYKDIEKVDLKSRYEITENPGSQFAKYLVNLKATQAFSKDKQEIGRIEQWFLNFEDILKNVFDDPSVHLEFDGVSFQFSIRQDGHLPFDFNTMSAGYAAVFDIINDLMIRMEAQMRTRSSFEMEGIVFIDEIETHLHLELQKTVLPLLTGIFPNIQFVLSTHSPFVLNSVENAVIYDLEKDVLVENGMGNLPYEGIVEGYFGADRLSEALRSKFERYKELVSRASLSNAECAELSELEYYLDEIPDYLAADLTTEYRRLKLEFEKKGD